MRRTVHGSDCSDSCCLRVQHLTVKIGNEEILQDINMHIHCGQLVALIGPNGAGKSTFLKTVLGQLDYSGIIAFSAPNRRHHKLRIGYVPQSPTFDPGDPISVADLFTCSMNYKPMLPGKKKALRQKILECLDRVHGTDLIDKRVGTLSGGELQRALLALALEPLPNILVLDEPLSGVDVEGMTTLMDMLDEIRKTYDLSILMTTHDFQMLPRYANQVVLIDHSILCKGEPADVLNSPEFMQVFHMNGGAKL